MNYELSSYLTGLTHMASSMSSWIGPSYIEAKCFDYDNYMDCFKKCYEIKDDVSLKEADISFKDLLISLLGNDTLLIDSLMHYIHCHLGDAHKIYEVTDTKIFDKIGSSGGGNCLFYIVDDLYFVEFDEYIVSFMMGNNE